MTIAQMPHLTHERPAPEAGRDVARLRATPQPATGWDDQPHVATPEAGHDR